MYNNETVIFSFGTESSFKNGVALDMKRYASNDVYQREVQTYISLDSACFMMRLTCGGY